MYNLRVEKEGGRQFLEGIEPESVKNVEDSFRRTIQQEQPDLEYQQAPEHYKIYITDLFDNIYEKISKERPELASLSRTRRDFFIRNIVLRLVSNERGDGDDLQNRRQFSEEELDMRKQQISSFIEACLREEAEGTNKIDFLLWETGPADGGRPRTRLGRLKNTLHHRKGQGK